VAGDVDAPEVVEQRREALLDPVGRLRDRRLLTGDRRDLAQGAPLGDEAVGGRLDVRVGLGAPASAPRATGTGVSS
jgi:hypothetical protein